VLVVRVKAVELYGEHVRVLAYRDNGKVQVELTVITDPTYEHPVMLIVDEDRVHSEVEKLIDEIAQLLRRAVQEVTESEVQ
jgi:hypothetical protein